MSLVDNRRDLTDLEIALGHVPLDKAASRSAIIDPDYLGMIKSGIDGIVADFARQVGLPLHAIHRVIAGLGTPARSALRWKGGCPPIG